MQARDWKKDSYLTEDLLQRKNDCSPDFLEWKNTENIPVFVYGNERLGKKHQDVLRPHTYMGEGVTVMQHYLMERTEYDGPIVFSAKKVNVNTHGVMGDVFFIPAITLLELDYQMANNEMTVRTHAWVTLLEQTQSKARPCVRCWMYIAKPEFWEDQATFAMPLSEMATEKGRHKVFDWNTKEIDFIPEFLKKGMLTNLSLSHFRA